MSSNCMCETKVMHRGIRGSVALLVAMGGLIGTSGCGGSGGSGTAQVTPVTEAAYVTTRGPGFKFALTISASVGGHSFTFGGEGALDERHLQGTISMKINGNTLNEITKYPYIYVQVPSTGNAGLAAGKPWVRANINVYSQALGAGSPIGANSSGPSQILNLLKASAKIMKLDSQTIRGVETTHYHALVDLSRYAAIAKAALRASAQKSAALLKRMTGSSSLPIEVWVDAQQRVRRMSMQFQACTKEGKLNESMSMDLYDYGRQSAVLPPPESQVTDITGKLESQVSQSLQQLGC
jgi:hypothetical protein